MRAFLLLLMLAAFPARADQVSDLLALHQAYRASDYERVKRWAAKLDNTPLEVYGEYYLLRLKLDLSDEPQIKRFLARPEDTPLIDFMRVDWLKLLGKHQQWEKFSAEYPKVRNEDIELTCYALLARWHTGEAGILQEARKQWFTSKGLPDNCGDLFDIATAHHVINQQDIWQRIRMALEVSNTELALKLDDRLTGNRLPDAALKSANRDPAHYLKSVISQPSAWNVGKRAVVLFALQRIAKQSPDAAYDLWRPLQANFSEIDQQYMYGWLGYEASRRHEPNALAWFKLAGDQLNELQLVWRARAALRAQNWPLLLSYINALNEKQQREPAWRYWKARALNATGNNAEANKIWLALSGEINFYGLLANEELSSPVMKNAATSFKPQSKDLAAMRDRPGIQRTLLLYSADMRSEALKEWSWALRNFSDQELITAAELAKRNDMYDRAIGAADRTVSVHDFSLRYLAPYRNTLRPYIRDNELEEAWVYGLMRQESRFATGARSNVGASGIMQVMPATAKWLANKMGLKGFRESMLHHLDTNLRLGTFYMKDVYNQLNGNTALASAAYNAGPGRARRWRAETPLEGAIYAETIPFEETRDYVKKVLSNTMYYTEQFNAPHQPLKQRLGIIPAKPPATP